jgi:hypothetical protein
MNRIVSGGSLLISGFYLFTVVTHMVRPADNTAYTRMLMFACLATIPLAFMMVFVGGRDRWPQLLSYAKQLARGGPSSILLLAGLSVLLVIMPVGMLAGVWAGLGLGMGLLFLLFFVPVMARLALAPARVSVTTAVTQAVLFFASFFIGIGIVFLLETFGPGAESYEKHLQVIWPGYGSAAQMFFAVCVFALLNQLHELVRAVMAVVGKGQA